MSILSCEQGFDHRFHQVQNQNLRQAIREKDLDEVRRLVSKMKANAHTFHQVGAPGHLRFWLCWSLSMCIERASFWLIPVFRHVICIDLLHESFSQTCSSLKCILISALASCPQKGYSMLVYAVDFKSPEIVKFLLEKNADIHFMQVSNTSVH